MTTGRHVPEDACKRIVELLRQGVPSKAIASRFGLTQTTIRRVFVKMTGEHVGRGAGRDVRYGPNVGGQ